MKLRCPWALVTLSDPSFCLCSLIVSFCGLICIPRIWIIFITRDPCFFTICKLLYAPEVYKTIASGAKWSTRINLSLWGQDEFWLRQLDLGCQISRLHIPFSSVHMMCTERWYVPVHPWEQWRVPNKYNRQGGGNPQQINKPTSKTYTVLNGPQGNKWPGVGKVNCFDKMSIIPVTYLPKDKWETYKK